MVVEAPEVFHGVEVDDGPLVVLPRTCAIVLEEPQSPRVLSKEEEKQTRQKLCII